MSRGAWTRTKYPAVTCVCGRVCGNNVFKQHGRKCAPMLKEWAKDTKCMVSLLDERSHEEKVRNPIWDFVCAAWTNGSTVRSA